jgi:hypothetical protein
VGHTTTVGYAVGRWAMALAAGGLATGLLTGCVSIGFGQSQPTLNLATLPGTWVSGDGARITFTSDNTFTAANFNYGRVMPPCKTLSGAGTWQVDRSSDEEYPGPPAAGPDHLLELSFTGVSPPVSCSGVIELTTWDVVGAHGLCVELAMDDPCEGYVFTKR